MPEQAGQVLLSTGVPMLDMLRITADAVNNVIISRKHNPSSG
ncbi:hypothetical protein [Candidatus Minimicrobia naudis]